jgi:hypothetical protein
MGLSYRPAYRRDERVRQGQDAQRHGQVISFNGRALEVLKMWTLHFPDRQCEHFVFPAERYGLAGDGLEAVSYDTDLTQPIASIRKAWKDIVDGLQPTILATFAIGNPASSIRETAVCLRSWNRHSTPARFFAGADERTGMATSIWRSCLARSRPSPHRGIREFPQVRADSGSGRAN